jgi:hypothetical protein
MVAWGDGKMSYHKDRKFTTQVAIGNELTFMQE